jgi:alpha-tubulin suppressor-like RCC1 family protein
LPLSSGKLGLSDDQNRLVPTEIRLLRRKMVKEICCGSFHTMALTQTGDLYTWGIGERGQLGHGDLENRNAPKAIQHLQGIEIGAIAAGEAHSLAATKDRMRVYAWGTGHYGQLGVGGLDHRLTPTPIQDLEGQKVIHVACGANHSGAVALGASEEAGMAKVSASGCISLMG